MDGNHTFDLFDRSKDKLDLKLNKSNNYYSKNWNAKHKDIESIRTTWWMIV